MAELVQLAQQVQPHPAPPCGPLLLVPLALPHQQTSALWHLGQQGRGPQSLPAVLVHLVMQQ